jgi:hypothetical protein
VARLSVAALVVGIAVVACDQGEKTAARVHTDAEIAALEARFRERIVADTDQRCAEAATDIVAFSEPADAVLSCVGEVRKLLAPTKAFTSRDPHDALLEPVASGPCGQVLEDAIVRVASHRDACSPYQVGQRAVPEPPIAPLHVTEALTVRARVLADGGNYAPALTLTTRTLVAAQALALGNTPLIPLMISLASSHPLKIAPELVANAPAALADDLARALDRLIAREPRFGRVLKADHEHAATREEMQSAT